MSTNNLKISTVGGRSSSQISIYDYPEHLNPFYEDENHKRIRFWKIGKNKNYDGQSSRKGSFSFGGLKDIWAFKSFRLKKKPSSLGINKTSESPPPLRRQLAPNENHYGTYDPRMRHTVGIGNSNTLNNNFLRNVSYRSSLQDMKSVQNIEQNENGFGFKRNDCYRNTLQPTSKNRTSGISTQTTPIRRYVYGGSLTPQPRLRNESSSDDYSGISRGSSQISVCSKNPFEEDDDNDIVIGKISSLESSGNNEKQKRYVRKKRRAPPPPIPISKIINEELQIHENDDNSQNVQENAQITNLAVEIQNFVKSTDESEDNKIQSNKEDKTFVTTESSSQETEIKSNESLASIDITKNNSTIKIETIIPKKNSLLLSDENQTDNNEIILRKTEINEEELISENEKKQICSESDNENSEKEQITLKIIETRTNTENVNEENSDKVNIIEEDSDQEENVKEENYESENIIQEKSNQENISNENVKQEITKLEDKVEFSYSETSSPTIKEISECTLNEAESKDLPSLLSSFDNEHQLELKITESVEDLSETSEKSQKSEICNETVNEATITSVEKPLNNQNEEIKKNNFEMEEIKTVTNENQNQRRRSVREIIESINRNQKLLKVNQSAEDINHNNDSLNQNYVSDFYVINSNVKPPPRKKHETKEKVEKIVNQMVESTKSEEDIFDENIFDKINNNDIEKEYDEIFKKCVLKKEINRESSPTSSNLDWNPVPKPKRTKKLSVDQL